MENLKVENIENNKKKRCSERRRKRLLDNSIMSSIV